jgi:hypothetical protein
MPSGFLNEDDGAYLVCVDCGQQVRSNEYHTCNAEIPGSECDREDQEEEEEEES